VSDAGRSHRPVGVFAGLCTLDVIHRVDAAPAVNEKVTARSQAVAAGGPATNAAVTFAALGGAAVLVTALGRGAAARLVRSDLEACGVRLVDVAPEQEHELPISSITVRAGTGERSVVSVDAATTTPEFVASLDTVVAGADVVLVDGHHPVLAEEASRAAAEASIPLVLDAGRWRPIMRVVIPRATAVICSADFCCPRTDGVAPSAEALAARGVSTVVVTSGSDPVLWWQDDTCGSFAPPSVRVVDTAGAGDAFHGAYCFFLASTQSPAVERLISAACRVASLKCAFEGTRTWLRHLPKQVT